MTTITVNQEDPFLIDVMLDLPAAAIDVIVEGTPTIDIFQGTPGDKGDPGTMIYAIPYEDWPPASPLPNTLYLRLEP